MVRVGEEGSGGGGGGGLHTYTGTLVCGNDIAIIPIWIPLDDYI